jgi:hypothetical protein
VLQSYCQRLHVMHNIRDYFELFQSSLKYIFANVLITISNLHVYINDFNDFGKKYLKNINYIYF